MPNSKKSSWRKMAETEIAIRRGFQRGETVITTTEQKENAAHPGKVVAKRMEWDPGEYKLVDTALFVKLYSKNIEMLMSLNKRGKDIFFLLCKNVMKEGGDDNADIPFSELYKMEVPKNTYYDGVRACKAIGLLKEVTYVDMSGKRRTRLDISNDFIGNGGPNKNPKKKIKPVYELIKSRKKEDNRQFVKLYGGSLDALIELKGAGQKVFLAAARALCSRGREEKDIITLGYDKKHPYITQNMSRSTFLRGLKECEEKEILEATPVQGRYLVNINVFFKGDRKNLPNFATSLKKQCEGKNRELIQESLKVEKRNRLVQREHTAILTNEAQKTNH